MQISKIIILNKSKGLSFKKVNKVLFDYAERVSDDLWEMRVAFTENIKESSVLVSLMCDLKKLLNRDVNVSFYCNKEMIYNLEEKYTSNKYKNDWEYIHYIKSLVGIAGLFHDIGKTNHFFQKKLRKETDAYGDPIRHEFLSCKIMEAIYFLYKDKWIDFIISDKVSLTDISKYLLNDSNKNKINVKDMPFYIKVVLYLILSHHKLPTKKNENFSIDSLDIFFEKINFSFGYKNKIEDDDIYSFYQLVTTKEFNQQLKKYGYSLIKSESAISSIVNDVELFHLFVSFSRMFLMMADHYVSSNKESYTKEAGDIVWANKNWNGTFNQTLLFHLVAVSKKTVEIAQKMEGILVELPFISNELLNKKSPSPFKWQDNVAGAISQYVNEHKGEQNLFFCCNMASTGKGKTIANAKIERAMLSGKLRYTLGVGLRTLVLQTGDSYIQDIHFNKKDVSICVGNRTNEELHKKDSDFYEEDLMHNQNIYEINSDKELLDNEVKFLEVLFKHQLKYKAFLYKPILVCTIDYMMRLTQCVKGGKYMLPFMRLLSSDLVIDEIDDYDIQDLTAILPLAYFIGMCGRNFTISSATITPDLAEAMNTAYQKGIIAYEKFFNKKVNRINVICDEYDCILSDNEKYHNLHTSFSAKRNVNLEKEIINRRGKIIPVSSLGDFVTVVHNAVLELHNDNHVIDSKTKKNVSIGCIRMANVNPCVLLTKALTLYNDEDYEIRVMCYHSRQILLLRHEQEVYLSKVLNRKKEVKGEYVNFKDSIMRDIIDNSKYKNIIFLLVATPIEEVGRDHDFDWCIIEPSSIHSIIQMAGRVLRHRHLKDNLNKKNIGILQYNYAHLTSKYEKVLGNKCFLFPGVEGNKHISLSSHDMNKVISDINIEERINSVPSIIKPDLSAYNSQKNSFNVFDSMNKAEHYEFQTLNDFCTWGADMVYDYIYSYVYLTGLPQTINHFRDTSNNRDIDVIAWIGDNHKDILLCQYNSDKQLTQVSFPLTFDISGYNEKKLWFVRNYKESLKKLNNGKSDSENSQFYGEATVIPSDKKHNLFYNDNFGFYR